MRIGFDAKRAFLNKAGLGTYSRNTLVALQKYYPEHQYILFTPEIRTDLFKEYLFFDTTTPGNRLFRLMNSLWRSFFMTSAIKNKGIDLFHGLSNELPGNIHKMGIPAVVTIHDLIFMNFPGLYKAIDRKIYYEKVKYACNTASHVIATSRQTRNDLIHHLGMDPDKVEVIYQSISERFFLNHYQEDSKDVLKRYNLPEYFILTVGTIEPRKNQLGVVKSLYRSGINVPYVLVGKSTPYAKQIMEYAETNGIRNQIIILNNVPDYDLPALYQQARCLVYLSHYEGFGLPVIEAMACGCPVITSSVSCLPEIGGDAALYGNPDDQEAIGKLISQILDNRELAVEMSLKGKKRAMMFHPEGRIDSLMAFYKKVLSDA